MNCIYQCKVYELVCVGKNGAKIRSNRAEFVKRSWFRKVYTNTKWVKAEKVIILDN